LAAAAAPQSCSTTTVSVVVDTMSGIGIGTGTNVTCFAALTVEHSLDLAWLQQQLAVFAKSPCVPKMEIAATKITEYQAIIAVLDAAKQAGLLDMSITQIASLAHAAGVVGKSPRTCAALVVQVDPVAVTGPAAASNHVAIPLSAKSITEQLTLPIMKTDDRLVKAPIVVMTKDDVTLQRDGVATPLGTLQDLLRGSGRIAGLANALPAHPQDPTVILQADRSTPMSAIDRVIETAHAQGYDNVLFAVRNK
jgi:biopolymer transport protein ExbD